MKHTERFVLGTRRWSQVPVQSFPESQLEEAHVKDKKKLVRNGFSPYSTGLGPGQPWWHMTMDSGPTLTKMGRRSIPMGHLDLTLKHWFGIWEIAHSLAWTGLLIRSYGETIFYSPHPYNRQYGKKVLSDKESWSSWAERSRVRVLMV